MGDDVTGVVPLFVRARFLSTSPAWGTTVTKIFKVFAKIFLSTSPAWGTTGVSFGTIAFALFLSTSPAWGTTRCAIGNIFYILYISIHVPRVGDDLLTTGLVAILPYFYPRPPRGGRPSFRQGRILCSSISIHVPRVGDDLLPVADGRNWDGISIHVPRVGDD